MSSGDSEECEPYKESAGEACEGKVGRERGGMGGGGEAGAKKRREREEGWEKEDL